MVLSHHLLRIRLSRYQLRLQSLEILTEALGSTSRLFTHTAIRSSQFLIVVVLFISCLSVFTTWQTFSTVSSLRVSEKEAIVSFIIESPGSHTTVLFYLLEMRLQSRSILQPQWRRIRLHLFKAVVSKNLRIFF